MKFDKWTVALATLGVVSLASAARAEEKISNNVLTAVSQTTISGYVDTSAQWNIGTGNDFLPDYRFGGTSKADGFNLNVVQIRIAKDLDEATWAAGYKVDLWAGPDANVLNTQSLFGNGGVADQGDFAIRQAYVALRAPMGNGLDLKVGVFDSVVGYESLESGNNPNFTRSYGNTIEPTTHTGVLASYRFCDMFSASAGVANTVGPMINERAFSPYYDQAESSKTYMGSVAITAPDSMGVFAGSTLYAGIVNGFSSSYVENQSSYYAGLTLATPVSGLRVGAAFDYLDVHHVGGETWSVAGYASFQATEKLSLHLRGEYFRDRGDQVFSFNPEKTLGLTGTIQYDLWANVISRLEVRWDHSLSGEPAWGNNADEVNAVLVAANVIYKF